MRRTVKETISGFIMSSSKSTVITTKDNRIHIQKRDGIIIIEAVKEQRLLRGQIKVTITKAVKTMIDGNITKLEVGTSGFIMSRHLFLKYKNKFVGIPAYHESVIFKTT